MAAAAFDSNENELLRDEMTSDRQRRTTRFTLRHLSSELSSSTFFESNELRIFVRSECACARDAAKH